MKNRIKLVIPVLVPLAFMACMGEAKEKLKTAKESVSNATTLIKEAREVEGRMEKLKNETALTNDQLKEWLPTNLDGFERSGFKVGQAGYAGVNSVEGTFKSLENEEKLKVMVIDAAGPTGGVMAAGYGVFGNLEMEIEDERKHQQKVTVDGIMAQQTYFKKRNDTELQFLFRERFIVTINSSNMNAERTWEYVDELDFDALEKISEK